MIIWKNREFINGTQIATKHKQDRHDKDLMPLLQFKLLYYGKAYFVVVHLYTIQQT